MEFFMNGKVIFLFSLLFVSAVRSDDRTEQEIADEKIKELYNEFSWESSSKPYSFDDLADQLESVSSLMVENYYTAMAGLVCTGVAAEVAIQRFIPKSQKKIRNLARIVAATALYSFGVYVDSIAQQEDFPG
jgi:hypothetical protein